MPQAPNGLKGRTEAFRLEDADLIQKYPLTPRAVQYPSANLGLTFGQSSYLSINEQLTLASIAWAVSK